MPLPNSTIDSSSATATGQAPKPKGWYTRAAVILLDSVVLLVVLNLVLYVIMRRGSATKPQTPQISEQLQKAYPGWREQDLKTLLHETSAVDTYEYEPFTGFREMPFRGEFVNVDPAGFRLSKNQAPWPPRPQTINVFVFGGSTAFGFGLADDETIASYLQELAATAQSSPSLAVYNFARPAYFSSQERILFEQLLNAGFVPQVAIFVDGVNDFMFAEGPLFGNRFSNFMAGRAGSSTFANVPMIRAAHWLRARGMKAPPQNVPRIDDPTLLQGVMQRWLANKRMIEVTASGYGVRPIFVWQPVPTYQYDLRYHLLFHSEKGFEEYAQRCKYGYPIVENLWAQGKLGPDFLWLADLQQDKRENLYVDALHYNAAFSKEIAARIYGSLSQPSGTHN